MELMGFDPGGKAGDGFEFAQQVGKSPAAIVALAELFDLLHQSLEGLLGLTDGRVRVVLALPFQTGIVLLQLLTEEVRQTVAGSVPQRLVGRT